MSIFCTTIYTAKLHTSCHDSFTCQPRQIQPHSMICAIVAYAVNNGNHAVNCRPAGTCFFAQRVLLPNYGRHASLHSKCWHIAVICARTHYNQSEYSSRSFCRTDRYSSSSWRIARSKPVIPCPLKLQLCLLLCHPQRQRDKVARESDLL